MRLLFMKIAIVCRFSVSLLEFFLNVGRYLELQGHIVNFIDPNKYFSNTLRKLGFNILYYDRDVKNSLSSNEFSYMEESSFITHKKIILGISDTRKLIKHANYEYAKSIKFFSGQRYDYVLIWNGCMGVEPDVCKVLGQKTFYFENGYLPKTLQMNTEGVNKDAEYSRFPYKKLIEFNYEEKEVETIPYEKIHLPKQNIKYYFHNLIDPFYIPFMKYAILRRVERSAVEMRYNLRQNGDKIVLPERFILVVLQVNSDTQIVLNSTYGSMYQVIDKIISVFGKFNIPILLKEHPNEIMWMNYDRYNHPKKVSVLRGGNLNELIDRAEFVVTVNSSVGFQALAKYKKVIVMGDAFYSSCPGCISFEKLCREVAIEQIFDMTIKKDYVDRFIKHFKENIFIPGSWSNLESPCLNAITRRLT